MKKDFLGQRNLLGPKNIFVVQGNIFFLKYSFTILSFFHQKYTKPQIPPKIRSQRDAPGRPENEGECGFGPGCARGPRHPKTGGNIYWQKEYVLAKILFFQKKYLFTKYCNAHIHKYNTISHIPSARFQAFRMHWCIKEPHARVAALAELYR